MGFQPQLSVSGIKMERVKGEADRTDMVKGRKEDI